MIYIAKDMREVHQDVKSFDGNTWTSNDEVLAKNAAELLNKHYPNHLWAVNVNSSESGGVMVIKNFSISFKFGMILHLNKLDPTLKKVIQAGGELLERARMARSRWNGVKASYVEGIPDKYQKMGIIT